MSFFRSSKHQERREKLAAQISQDLSRQEIGPEEGRFVPITAIEDILTEQTLHVLFEKVDWYDPGRVRNLRSHSKVIIAVLIYAGWNQWDRLPDFLCPDKSFEKDVSKCTDVSLPLTEQFLADFDTRYGQRIRPFSAYQFTFIPVVIEENTYGRFSKRRRLPYVNEPQQIGSGAYGSVYKVTIAKRYLASGVNHQDSNQEDRVMAVKIYRSEGRNHSTFGADFEREQNILKKFKRALISVSAVAKNFAAFVHGNDLNIISDLAEMDLAAFLSGEYLGFESLAANSSHMCPFNIIDEVWNLFNAMVYLHGGLPLGPGRREEIVHMDLKPDNILVFGPLGERRHPVGQWKVADFNLAESSDLSQRQTTTEMRSNVLTLGGLIREKSSRHSRPEREGAYLPPELRNRHRHQADKKTDVWSLGCIMADLLAFAVGGPQEVQRMHESLISRDDYFYDIAYNGRASLKTSFLTWLNGPLGSDRDGEWIQEWRNLILSMLEINREERCHLGSDLVRPDLPNIPSANQKLEDLHELMKRNRDSKRRLWRPQTAVQADLPLQAAPSPLEASTSVPTDSGLPSPGQQVQNTILGTVGGLWSFLRLNFLGVAIGTSVSPSGRRAAIWTKKSLLLYDLTFRGQEYPMWLTDERSVRNRPGLPAQCNWAADEGFNWTKVRITANYVALLQMNVRGGSGKVTLHTWQDGQNIMHGSVKQSSQVGDLDDIWISEQGALLLQFHDHLDLYHGSRRYTITLQAVLGSCFSMDGQSICAWQRISDDEYWHVWNLDGEEIRTQQCRWKSFPNIRPHSEQTLVPFKHGQRWAACDIHGRLLLIDSSSERPILRKDVVSNFVAGHAMPDDRHLLVIRDRKPQNIALLTLQQTDLPTLQNLGEIPEPLAVVPFKCSTTVATLDVHSSAPCILILHQNGLIARKQFSL